MAQSGTIQKLHSFMSSRLSSTAVRNFGSGEITDGEHQCSNALRHACHLQNFIPSNMSDSTGISLRLMEANSGISSG